MGYRASEHLLIVTDTRTKPLARAFHKEVLKQGVITELALMPTRKMHGEEPPKHIGERLGETDLALLLTHMSLSHTKARKSASKKGVRMASLPGATYEMLKRAIPIDYTKLHQRASKLAGRFSRAKTIELRTKKGTKITAKITGRKGHIDDGLYVNKGDFGNLPAGEACIGPVEGTANGRLIVDGTAPFLGRIKRPFEVVIKKGRAVYIENKRLEAIVQKHGLKGHNIAEIGIGLNPKARVTGKTLESEKALKTAHVALENNKSFGGKVGCKIHLDLVILDPKIRLT